MTKNQQPACLRINATTFCVQDAVEAEIGHMVSVSGHHVQGCSCGAPGCDHRVRVAALLASEARAARAAKDNAARAATIASGATRQTAALNGNRGFSLF